MSLSTGLPDGTIDLLKGAANAPATAVDVTFASADGAVASAVRTGPRGGRPAGGRLMSDGLIEVDAKMKVPSLMIRSTCHPIAWGNCVLLVVVVLVAGSLVALSLFAGAPAQSLLFLGMFLGLVLLFFVVQVRPHREIVRRLATDPHTEFTIAAEGFAVRESLDAFPTREVSGPMLVCFGPNGVRFGSEKTPGVDDVGRSRILSVDAARAIPLIGFSNVVRIALKGGEVIDVLLLRRGAVWSLPPRDKDVAALIPVLRASLDVHDETAEAE